MKFKELIENIELRPKSYLRNESILEFSTLLLGFSLSNHDIDKEEAIFFEHFNAYVNSCYNHDENYNWAYLFLILAGGDEKGALSNFYMNYHKFMSQYCNY